MSTDLCRGEKMNYRCADDKDRLSVGDGDRGNLQRERERERREESVDVDRTLVLNTNCVCLSTRFACCLRTGDIVNE